MVSLIIKNIIKQKYIPDNGKYLHAWLRPMRNTTNAACVSTSPLLKESISKTTEQ